MGVYIIAEAGINHNGSFELAKQMIDKAVEAGADAVKFQTFVPRNLVSRYAEKAEYQKLQTGADENQLKMLLKLALKPDEYVGLNEYCKVKNIEFLSTAFDFDSVDFLESIGMKTWKIPSGEITNLPLLVKVARRGNPIILSTGMSTIQEVKDAVTILKENGADEVTVLHCNTEYPTPFEDVNLRAMLTIKETLNVPVGYSDHTLGIEAAVAAVALSAIVIEKHFTLDRNMDGPDHKASLEPDELKSMVLAVRNIEKAMGTGEKKPSPSEQKNMSIARKSLVALRDIRQGELLSEDNITTKRPGNGVSPMRWYEVLGTKAIRDFEEDELIDV